MVATRRGRWLSCSCAGGVRGGAYRRCLHSRSLMSRVVRPESRFRRSRVQWSDRIRWDRDSGTKRRVKGELELALRLGKSVQRPSRLMLSVDIGGKQVMNNENGLENVILWLARQELREC